MSYHVPVLLKESIDGLNIREGGTYVDVTFGGGGHSREILERLKGGRLVAFDQDKEASANLLSDERLIFIHQNFRYLKKYLQLYNLLPVDGILADLGISSHQIDTPERGFSTRYDAELDMRMDDSATLSARDILNTYSAQQLQDILGRYGEVRNAKTLAMLIVEQRTQTPIERTEQFKEMIRSLAKGNPNRYYAQVFQALRIEVNKELEVLEEMLMQSAEVLAPGGRLSVISYHSLEDRMVKNFMKSGNVQGEVEKDLFGNTDIPMKQVTKKPIEASAAEVKENPRARSARLRVAEKV